MKLANIFFISTCIILLNSACSKAVSPLEKKVLYPDISGMYRDTVSFDYLSVWTLYSGRDTVDKMIYKLNDSEYVMSSLRCRDSISTPFCEPFYIGEFEKKIFFKLSYNDSIYTKPNQNNLNFYERWASSFFNSSAGYISIWRVIPNTLRNVESHRMKKL